MRVHHSTATPTHGLAADHRRVAQGDALEWEELPSLSRALWVRHAGSPGQPLAGHAWDNTQPASLDPPRPAAPFAEVLRGLAVREVLEPEVFRHFFGRTD